MEGCNIGDMTAIAVKLTQLEMGDQYWEDVDRYVRNSLTAIQCAHPGYAEAKFTKLWEMGHTRKVPLEYHQLADHLPQRLVGSFANYSMPNARPSPIEPYRWFRGQIVQWCACCGQPRGRGRAVSPHSGGSADAENIGFHRLPVAL
jgi:hypothetical protein